MKILQILPELHSGGVERGTLELARYLTENGHESVVVSNGGPMVSQLEDEGSHHIKLPVHKKHLISLKQVFTLRELFLKEAYDVIHLRSRMPAWLAFIACKLIPKASRPKIVTTFHGFYSINRYSAIMAKGDHVICVSESVKKYVLKHFPDQIKGPLTVIHRGIDPDFFQYGFKPDSDWVNNWHETHKNLDKKFLVTLPGRITSWKGHIDFVEIIKLLKGDGIPVHGLIIGDTHSSKSRYYSKILELVRNLELEEDFTFLGHRRDVREVMAISDLVVSCSKVPEAFGRVSLEALGIGKPIFAYAHGGVEEQLNVLFPEGKIAPNNKTSMRIKIREFYLASVKAKPLRNTKFTLEKTNSSVLKIYKKTLNEKYESKAN